MNNRLLVPYLMGQRRDGLGRLCALDRHPWDVLAVPGCDDTLLTDSNEKMRRMGRIYAQLASSAGRVRRAGRVPVSIAGDCVSTLGMLGGLQQAGCPPDRILWLDAHGDFHTWETTRTQYLGGMPLAMLVGRRDRRQRERDAIGALRAAIGVQPYREQQVVLSDARDLDPGETEAIRASGVVCCGIDQVLDQLHPRQSLYLHFDTDVIDAPEAMPALKYHVKHGPSPADIGALFRALRGFPLLAVSVSAWHEEQDLDNRAALACLALLDELVVDGVNRN